MKDETIIALGIVVIFFLLYLRSRREGYLADYMKYGWCACRDTMAMREDHSQKRLDK